MVRPAVDAGGHVKPRKEVLKKWPEVISHQIEPASLNVMSPSNTVMPLAMLRDNPTYSAFAYAPFHRLLRERQVSTLLVSGGETGVCVLPTILATVNLGYPATVPLDAISSSCNRGQGAGLARLKAVPDS